MKYFIESTCGWTAVHVLGAAPRRFLWCQGCLPEAAILDRDPCRCAYIALVPCEQTDVFDDPNSLFKSHSVHLLPVRSVQPFGIVTGSHLRTMQFS